MKYTSKSIIKLPAMIEKDCYGKLYPLEPPELPFNIARTFWVVNVPPGQIRGAHAHIECKQFYVCVKGCLEIQWHDGVQEGKFVLKEGEGVLIDVLLWTQETFLTGEDILFVFCSEKYSSDDYINTIEQLKKYKNENSK